MKTSLVTAPIAAAIALVLSACSSSAPPVESHRPIRSVEVHYGETRDVNRYFASVQSRFEVDQAFRVGGKVVARRVDLGQAVRKGDILAVLDDSDYRLSEDAARRQSEAAQVRLRQAKADLERMQALKADGSVSASEEEHAKSAFDTALAAATAEANRLEIARNQLEYTALRAPRDGVVAGLMVEVGQVVAAGQPVVTVADQGLPEIVVDVPEDHLERFKVSTFTAVVPSASAKPFKVELRELSAQASTQTRTYRARLRPAGKVDLPLGASATLVAENIVSGTATATLPAAALSQLNGKPAVWAARRVNGSESLARVEILPVDVHGYRNDQVLVTGLANGTTVVAAGVQKMSPGLIVTLPERPEAATTTAGAK